MNEGAVFAIALLSSIVIAGVAGHIVGVDYGPAVLIAIIGILAFVVGVVAFASWPRPPDDEKHA